MDENLEIKRLRDILGSTIYLYDPADNSLTAYGGEKISKTPAPGWMSALASSGQRRKMFQKDGRYLAYHCFPNGEKFVLFQDDPTFPRLQKLAESALKKIDDPPCSAVFFDKKIEEYKKELINSKSEQTKLRLELRKRDAAAKAAESSLSGMENEIRSLNKKVGDLTEANAAQNSQIKRMKADTDSKNFQKLKQINAELREEINEISFKSIEAEEKAAKIRKMLESTVTDLMRLLEYSHIDKEEIRKLISNIKFKDTPSDRTAAHSPARRPDIQDIINALNAAASSGNTTGIDVDKLATVVPITDKEGVKRSPTSAVKSIVGTLVGMSKAARITPRQIEILCDAVGLKR